MLTASQILKEREAGRLGIHPFNIDQLNPNSYNVKLANKLKVYNEIVLDFRKELKFETIEIPEEGLILLPGKLYIGATQEIISSDHFISGIDGRSSVGRLGLSIHATAGFGDVGFKGTYTLEIFVVEPVKIYPDMLIAQVHFTAPEGDVDFLYRGRYQGQLDPTTSKFNLTEDQLGEDYHYKS